MPRDAVPPERGWIAAGLGGILALTLWRVALLPYAAIDLFVDDAQYWLWGQELAWGYFSKPPLIGWILALSTGIGGDGAFWVRLPLPLIHAATAATLLALGTRLWGPRIGALSGLGFASLPGVSWGSLLLSTDTPLLLCFALAILAWTRLTERPSHGWAVALGLAVGVGLLAKYAMIYFALAAGLAAALLPAARVAWRDAGLAALVALTPIAPNLWWNLANDLATLRHTADNAGWEGVRINLGPFAEFVASQFAVMGPVLFAAYLVAAARALRGRADPRLALLVALSLPVLAIVCGQALLSRAYANWAAATYAGGTVAAMAVLAGRRGWLRAGLGLNLAIALALPLAATRADTLALGDRLVFERYLGRHAISRRAAEIAAAEGLGVIVARSRDLLADLFYTLRAGGLAIHAEPRPGPPAHHYAQRHALPADLAGDVLYLTVDPDGPACADGAADVRLLARWTPVRGDLRREVLAFRVAADCWAAAE